MSGENQPKPQGLIAAAIVAIYVGGYFVLSARRREPAGSLGDAPVTIRAYEHPSVKFAYYPLGWAECHIREEDVWLGDIDEHGLLALRTAWHFEVNPTSPSTVTCPVIGD